ncbi:MAG: CusA/CzcA family heavy metal efflux RND transporter [Phycisphaerales bacterium]|nr:CusA/CzcA family heavy metal efflux RND transporter [Phycisphaerales bacterium]
MFDAIITWSLRNRLIVIVLSLAIVGGGVYSLSELPIDAFPDTSPVQVQINTVSPALSPLEIEQQITLPVEQAIAGLPALEEVRSISKFGLSQVIATFEDGTDIYFARQLINERLQSVELAEGLGRPEMGPVATGLGEVFHYVITGKNKTLTELTTIQDWIIRPQLLTVPGVAEINTWGGKRKQYHVLVDPTRLVKLDLTLDDVVDALRRNNKSVGGGNIVQSGELHLVHGLSLTTTVDQIANIVITAHDGIPIRIRDIGQAQTGHEIRRGAVTANGDGETVLGLGFMLWGENSHEVTRDLAKRMEEVRTSLPEGVDIKLLYERTELVNQVIATVKKNLMEGALLVIAVLFIFLGNLRAGLIVALAIPLSMLFSFSAMLQFGIAGSLLSLGAIDFGLVVDSAVISVENSVRRLGKEADSRSIVEIVRDATIEVRRPTMFGELIIMVVYLPILLLEGVEGKLFRPMALTVVFALMGSTILSVTLIPVLSSLLLTRKIKERENILVRLAQWMYRPLIRISMRFRVAVACAGGLILLFGAYLATQLGATFIPRLYEQAIAINTVRLAGVSLDESVRYGTQLEKVIQEKFPNEVRDIWSRTGTAQVATDPMGFELTDIFITLNPREEWTSAETQEELTEKIKRELDLLPGMRTIFTQPIEMRMNEMTAGIRGDLGIKIFGDDLETLKNKAKEIQDLLETMPQSADVSAEQVTGQPVLEIDVNQDAIARYGVPAQHVLEIVEAIGQVRVSQVREGQRRFDLVVRLSERFRDSPEEIGRILVPTAAGERIPLSRLADIHQVEGPSTITREWQKRRVVVQANVKGRDLAGFVEKVRRRIADEIQLPPGYYVRFGGQFEHLSRASLRLMIIVPVALLTIFMLLYFSTDSIQDALLIATGAPFAAFGGIVALYLRDMPFTISAGVGFVAVSGVSVLNGLVLISTIRRKMADGVPIDRAIEETRLIRLRPILMTGLVAALGFVPMALNTSIGAEVQRPLATVVIGGVISDNILTLLMLPALFMIFGRHRRNDATEPFSSS